MVDAEKNQQSPIMCRSSIETKVDSQYLCQFTMLLIDTVEELTGRVSQIEFVCRQHFPDLQTLSQTIQNRILGFKKSEQLEWRKKEESLLSKINELQSESLQSQAQFKQLNASLEEAKEKLNNKEQLLNRYILEKKELLEQVVQKVNESVKAKGIEEDLRQQIELKDKKIEVELSRRKSLFGEYNRLKTNYKNLKSQYKFLTSKFDNEIPNLPNTDTDLMEVEKKSTDIEKKRCNEDMKNNIQGTAMDAFQLSKSKIDIPPKKGCAVDLVTSPKIATDASISTKQGLISLKPPLNAKKEPSSCWKGSISHWRDTRTREEIKVGDPHDDFLDTPIENAQNLKAETRKVKEDISPANECMDADCFDDETMDIKPEIVSIRNPISVAGPSKKPFKYVEPVRKKADRENLKGVECQQCKKFYDAVLPDGGKDAAATARCEHHDGVSRHRYRYAPPLTPEGFWNIGFDSDL